MCDPSVGAADSSPWQGSQRRWLAAGEATPPVRNPSGSQANHLPLTGEAMTVPLDRGAMARSYFLHVSGAKRTSMGKISRRPRNMSKHRTALLIILSPETPMVKVFESMP